MSKQSSKKAKIEKEQELNNEAENNINQAASKTNEAEVSIDEVNEESAMVENETTENSEITAEVTVEQSETEKLQEELSQMKDKYLRISAEFDNYRKRTLKEKMEMIKSAGEDILVNILPVVDNMERALKSIDTATEIEPVKEGITLIYNNFKDFLVQRGVKELPGIGEAFDTDKHEALTKIPAPSKELKGKVVDVIEKGYTLGDKVIRFAKVVIGD